MPELSREPFSRRVQSLRDAWSERRQVRALAGVRDFDSQFQLLILLHRWAEEAARDINGVYEDDGLRVEVTPLHAGGTRECGFSLIVASGYSLALSIVDRPRAGAARWSIRASINAGPGGVAAAPGPQRRLGQWTRSQVEDLVLSVLAAYERSLTGGNVLPAERSALPGA